MYWSFSSTEPVIHLDSPKDWDLWPHWKLEVCDSQTWCHIWHFFLAENTEQILCTYLKIGIGQRSRSLVQPKWIVGSGDENVYWKFKSNMYLKNCRHQPLCKLSLWILSHILSCMFPNLHQFSATRVVCYTFSANRFLSLEHRVYLHYQFSAVTL